jgi:hypothetical protein
LAFGEQRLLGHLNWTNTSCSFDAVRATIRYGGYRLDAFAASVVNLRNGEFDERAAGNNLQGLYAALEKLVPKATGLLPQPSQFGTSDDGRPFAFSKGSPKVPTTF